MIPITVSTLQLVGTVLRIMACSATACTDFLTFTVELYVSKFLTIETSEGVRNVNGNRYSKIICNVYVFWNSCGVKSEYEGASVATFSGS